MAEGGVGEHPFGIVLGDRHQGAADHGDQAEDHKDVGVLGALGREHRQHEAQEPIDTELRHHAAENHHCRAGSLGVGAGLPSVQGRQGNLDREGEDKTDEQPELGFARQHRRGVVSGRGHQAVDHLSQIGGAQGSCEIPDAGEHED